MDLSNLVYFKTVVEAGSMSKAAQELFISQPALSTSISKLEAEVGVKLFDRSRRRITLNRAGEEYYEKVVRALNELSQAKHNALAAVEHSGDVISLSSFTYVSFSTIIQPFLRLYPNCRFKLLQFDTDRILEKLLNYDIDFCLTCAPVISPHVECYHMLTQKLYLTVPANHPFSKKSYVRLDDARDEPFICMSRSSPFYDITMHCFDLAGFTPNVVCELSTASLMAGMINSGIGIALIPDTFSEHTTLRRVNISYPQCLHNVYFVWLKNRSFYGATQKFLDFTLDYYKDFPKNAENV